MVLLAPLAMAATLQTEPSGHGLQITITPDAGWEVSTDEDLGMTLKWTSRKDDSLGPLALDNLGQTFSIGADSTEFLDRLDRVTVQTHYTACTKVEGICKQFMLEGETEVDKRTASTSLTPMEDPVAYLARIEKRSEPYVRTITPRFERQETAYYAALDQGSGTRLTAARKAAADAGRALVVVVSKDPCGPCIHLGRDVLFAESDPFGLDVPWVLVDRDHEDRAAEIDQWKINGVPELRVLAPDGTVIDQHGGYGGDPTSLRRLWKRAAKFKP